MSIPPVNSPVNPSPINIIEDYPTPPEKPEVKNPDGGLGYCW